MTRWSIPVHRCDRCGAEVERRDESVRLDGWATLSAAGPGAGGKSRMVGDATAPADLCAACWMAFDAWMEEPVAPLRQPAPPPPPAPPPRPTITLASRVTIATIVAKAMLRQVEVAIALLRDQPSTLLLELGDSGFPDVTEGHSERALDAVNKIVEQLNLATPEPRRPRARKAPA